MEIFEYREPTEDDLNNIFSEDLPPEQRQRVIKEFRVEINGKPHKVQIEYEEIRPGVWKKIHGSERDLGPIEKETNQQ